MSQESAAEKTEEATPRRLREQREKGQVPRSRELGTFTVTVASVIAMAAAGPSMVDAVRSDLQQALRFDADSLRHNADLGTALGQGLWLGL
ncbi:MAG: EscU/YscU/HrcU family type III secretion system export apparatus switch protein, partial [Oceanococcaceae bacterium]